MADSQAAATQAQQAIANALAEKKANQPSFNQIGNNVYAIDPNTGQVVNTIKGLQAGVEGPIIMINL